LNGWVAALIPLAFASAVLVVPGYATVRTLGFRGLHAWAFAGPVSVPIIAGAALISPFVGVSWSILGVLAMTLIACAIALILRLSLRSRSVAATATLRLPARGAVIVALMVAGILIAGQFVLIVVDPENISQTFDNIFHLNAARYILDTHNASPLSVSQLTRAEASGLTFYPAVWHAIVALVAETTGTSLAIASNSVMIAAGALLWPASLMMLGVMVFGRSRAYAVALGILAAAAPAFPILMIDYGVLFPYFLALCTLPAIVAGTLAVLGLVDRSPAFTIAPWIIVLAAAVPGLLMVHPAAFVAWLLLAGVAAIVAFVRFVRRRPGTRQVWIATAALAAAGVAGLFLWRNLRPRIEENLWPPSETVGQAIGEVLTLSMERAQIPVALTVATLVGAYIAWRRGTVAARIAVGYLAILMALYVITASMQWLGLRRDIAAAWYDNSPRLAALIPLMAIPIAAVGIEALWRWLVRRTPDRFSTPGTAPNALLIAVCCVGLIAATQLISIPNAIERARLMYVPTDTSPLLTTDELALIQQLPQLVPEDAIIAGNPGTGTAMAYALADREVLHPSVVIDLNDDIILIDEETNEAAPGSAVCAALERTGVEYVLDFGRQEINSESHPYPGFQRLASSDAVALVKAIGDARLYEVVGCESD
jgi:hypothetical protein